MKRSSIMLSAFTLVALLVLPFPTASPAQGPNIPCPAGTTLVAKFEWDGSEYVPDPEGNENGVTIIGDARGGSWTSIEGIHYWIIKGATDTETYGHYYGPADPWVYAGDFSASDLEGPQGQEESPPDISNIQFCAAATAITLVSFSAKAGVGGVALAWETGTELDNAGFNLYRATSADGPYTQINEALIAAQGDAVAGSSYSFLDTPGYGTFYYQLEDVDYYGVSTLHGPVEATVARPFRRPLRRPFVPY